MVNISSPPQIYPLNVDVAAELRQALRTAAVPIETQRHILRLAGQAEAAGYQAGYTRGLVDGRHFAECEVENHPLIPLKTRGGDYA
jgi:hypothetical protein